MLSEKKILKHWSPLLFTWFLMALDLSIASAIVARGENAESNLAAFSISFALSLLLESPIIMMLVAPIKIVKGRQSFYLLRKFSYFLNSSLIFGMVFILIPGVFEFWSFNLLHLNKEVSSIVYRTLWFFLPWPAMIGYRRFYQGLLIKTRQNKNIVYGTFLRLLALILSAYILSHMTTLQSAELVALSMSLGVSVEAFIIKILSKNSVKIITAIEDDCSLTFRKIIAFYSPLVMTTVIGLSIQPLLNFSAVYGIYPIRSLAVLPIINSFTFLFKSVALSYQEVIVSLAEENEENISRLLTFVFKIAAVLAIIYVLIVFTPLNTIWFKKVVGLSDDLFYFSLPAIKLMIIMPIFSLVICWQKSVLIFQGQTKDIGLSSLVEIIALSLFLFTFLKYTFLPGVLCITCSLILGRFLSICYLISIRHKQKKVLLKNQ